MKQIDIMNIPYQYMKSNISHNTTHRVWRILYLHLTEPIRMKVGANILDPILNEVKEDETPP